MGNFSILNDYRYKNKKDYYSILDKLSYPLRTGLGGRTISVLGELEQQQTLSTAKKIILLLASLVLFPVGIVGLICLGIKRWHWNPYKEPILSLLPNLPFQKEQEAVPISLSNPLSSSVEINPASIRPIPSKKSSISTVCAIEARILAAKRKIHQLIKANPFLSTNGYYVSYRNGRQVVDQHPWKKAILEGNESAVRQYLDNPDFLGHNAHMGNFTALIEVVEKGYLNIFKLLVSNKKTDLRQSIWNNDTKQLEPLLLFLVKKGSGYEEYIHCLLDHGYATSDIEMDLSSLESYTTLSQECQKRIKKAQTIDKVWPNDKNNPQGYTQLEKAIIEGDLGVVTLLLRENACVNNQLTRPLTLAVRYYLNHLGGSKLSNRKEILDLVLTHPNLRVIHPDAHNLLIEVFSCSHPPQDFEKLVAQLIEAGVDPLKGNLDRFTEVLQSECIPLDSPIFQAFTNTQKKFIELSLLRRFLRTVLKLGGEANMPGDVYRILQKIWTKFQNSAAMARTFKPETISALTQSLSAIPLTFKCADAQNLADKIKEARIPMIIPSGWAEHATSIVFFGDRFIQGNCGDRSEHIESGLHIYAFNPDQLTAKALEWLPRTHLEKQGIFAYFGDRRRFETGLTEILGAARTEIFPLPEQDVGNCTWSSSALLGFESALYFLAEKMEQRNLEFVHSFIKNEFEPAVEVIAIEMWIECYKAALKTTPMVAFSSEELGRILTTYVKKAIQDPSNKHFPKIIDLVVFSGIRFYFYPDKDVADWLTSHYKISFWDKLYGLFNHQEICYDKLAPAWFYLHDNYA